jgi:hypothetical protein
MYILDKRIRNKSDVIFNLDYRSLDNGTLTKRHLKKGQLRHNPSSVREWYNSIYNLNKNSCVKFLPYKDKLVHRLLFTYFNIDGLKIHDGLSMDKIFVGKPEVKHFSNKIYITLYIFNKWITRFYRMTNVVKTWSILSSQDNKQLIMLEDRLFLMGALLLKHPKFDQNLIIFVRKLLVKIFNDNKNMFFSPLYINVITFFDRMDLFKISRLNDKAKRCLCLYLYIVIFFFNSIGFLKLINVLKKVLLYNLEENRINNFKTILNKLGKIYLTRLKINSLCSLIGLISLYLMLRKILKNIYIINWYKRNIYYSKYKFNVKNILNIKSIINKLYNNKIEINIINLKYLYLDGNILALAIARKLKSRRRRVLRVIRMALKLSKKPYISKFHSNLLNTNGLDTVFIRKNLNLSINKTMPLNKDLISKPMSYRSRIVFYYLKHKIINGMKLQGKGRLTKRLTASRSISKYMGKGSLKNRASSYNGLSTVVLRGYVNSNLQYVNVNSYNSIGTYGIKSWISSH